MFPGSFLSVMRGFQSDFPRKQNLPGGFLKSGRFEVARPGFRLGEAVTQPVACIVLIQKSMDFNQRPFTVVWETTRACDLACLHCRAEAMAKPDPAELNLPQAQKLMQDVKSFGAPYPIFVLTGGDPAKRADIFDIIKYARSEGLRVAMTPSATPLMTRDAVRRFAEAGLVRLAVSLDGKDSAAHDGFRGVHGSFEQTLKILDWCREFGLESQIHTTVTRHVLADLPAIAAMIAERGIKLWALFLLIAVGRAARPEIRRLNISAREIESLFHWLYDLTKSAPFDVTPREGYHYRRVLLQRRAAELAVPVGATFRRGARPLMDALGGRAKRQGD